MERSTPVDLELIVPIRWPDHYAPERVAARVSNTILIAATPKEVWSVLIRAAQWPNWYPNSQSVRLADGSEDLSLGKAFTWRTFGVSVRSTVKEFEPFERIAWDGEGLLLNVYHAWLIEPRASGSWVLTEEHQNGLAAKAQKALMPKRMFEGHEMWLARLKTQAESCAARR